MFGNFSKVKVKNLLIINNNGLTAQYVYIPESKKRTEHEKLEINRGLNKFLDYWEEISEKLKTRTNALMKENKTRVHSQQLLLNWDKTL